MNIRTSIRTGVSLWAAPFVIGPTLFFYFGSNFAAQEFRGYAPAIVAAPMRILSSLAYAVAASLAVWESGRLRNGAIWDLAPARSRFHVAANALIPVILLSWSVVLIPAALLLAETGTLPTIDSLRLPAMALLLCVAHAAVGFAVGLRLPHLLFAPLMAVFVWILVSFSRAVHPYWIRHISGQFGPLGFSELPTMRALMPPLLLMGGLALALALMWLPIRNRGIAAALALAVALGGFSGAYGTARNWPHAPPLLTNQAPVSCLGSKPQLCMPQNAAVDLHQAREEAVRVVRALQNHDVQVAPQVISDHLSDGRFLKPSTATHWRVGLTSAQQQGDVGYAVMLAAVKFPCQDRHPVYAQEALMWAAQVTGEEQTYHRASASFYAGANGQRVQDRVAQTVNKVLALSTPEQAAWFQRTVNRACTEARA